MSISSKDPRFLVDGSLRPNFEPLEARRYPNFRCRACGVISQDVGPYACFPGPAHCANCVQDAREAQRKAAKRYRQPTG